MAVDEYSKSIMGHCFIFLLENNTFIRVLLFLFQGCVHFLGLRESGLGLESDINRKSPESGICQI